MHARQQQLESNGYGIFFSYLSCAEAETRRDLYTVYRFGGGELRHWKYKYITKFHCFLGGRLLKLRTEVIDEDLPLLGNSFESQCVVIDIVKVFNFWQ